MEWSKRLAGLLIVMLGIVLFLIGANFYNNIAGWAGLFVFFGGILAYLFLRVLSRATKSSVNQKP
jgi:hypothetical protein